MSETASGLLRVVVLAVATAMFVAVWRGDQQTQQRFIIARRAAAETKRQILLAVQDRVDRNALHDSQADRLENVGHDVPSAAPPSPYVARVEVEMELPGGIAMGRYQVVDESGRAQTIHIRSGAAAQKRDIYILDQADGSRRVFIRTTDVDELTTAGIPATWRR